MSVTTFAYSSGGVQTYTVPAGILAITLEAWGAEGQTSGGLGGYAKGDLAVTPGQVLNLYVAGQADGITGGWNGGGNYGGAGATDVRVGGTALANRVIVAGGGGGGGSSSAGGAGGGTTGGSPAAPGGAGGTQSTGNALGQGGHGSSGARGGGGGYWGGVASGDTNFGGGGGSGYTGGVTNASMSSGVRTGYGQVVITTLNSPPNASTTTSPATGTTIDRAVTQRLGWTFSDPNLGDSQSAYDLWYKLVGAGSWTIVSDATTNGFWDAPPATFAAGDWEWQVVTYDSLGLPGPNSVSSFFTAADSPGVPSITAPTSGSTVAASDTVSWSVGSQTNYQVRRVADVAGVADPATVYSDTGDVVDGTTRSVVVAFPTNGRWEHVQVRVKAAGLWSTWADCRVAVSWTAPMVPTLTATADSATASISVVIVNPAPTGGEPVVSYDDVYVSSPLDPESRAATLVPPNSTWVWRTPAAGRVYTVRVVAVGTNGTTRTSV